MHLQHELHVDVLRGDELAVVNSDVIHLSRVVLSDQQPVGVIGNRLVPENRLVVVGQAVGDLLHAVVDQVERGVDSHSVLESEGRKEGVIPEASRITNNLIVVAVKDEMGL
jgi:hypothetical protein